ncbi:hypothetical protein C7212DRAFT_284400 [Tuber magnatum]|uniref:Uncharacterized protein n=1 Tax=Tuber magnatum TaxID=42249 RepID=A0A317SGB3_9PEZI|nr:hypothetical protein C7212DRAFT_284400 [Tuber magnatum]
MIHHFRPSPDPLLSAQIPFRFTFLVSSQERTCTLLSCITRVKPFFFFPFFSRLTCHIQRVRGGFGQLLVTVCHSIFVAICDLLLKIEWGGWKGEWSLGVYAAYTPDYLSELGGRHWSVKKVGSIEFTPIPCSRIILMAGCARDRGSREGFMDNHPWRNFAAARVKI